MKTTSVSGLEMPSPNASAGLGGLQQGQPFNPFQVFQGVFVPDALLRHRGINATAKFLWARLARDAAQHGFAYPAVPTLAAELGVSERQVQRGLAVLDRERFIRRDLQKTERGGFTNTHYVFLWHSVFSGAAALRTPAPQNRVVTQMSPGGEQDVTTNSKRRTEEKTSSSPSATTPPSPTPSPRAVQFDDDKPRTLKAELIELVGQATGEPADRRLIRDITDGLEIRGVPLREYLDDTRPRLARLKDRPRAGFFLSHANEWRDSCPAQLPAQPLSGEARCPHCSGTGRTQAGYCACGMGKELERVARRMGMPNLQQGGAR